MDKLSKVLVVGATGYLGLHIIKELQHQQINFIALARDKQKLINHGVPEIQIIEALATDPETLKGICKGIDVVISCLGITRQRDGLKYMDVDYQANMNVLLEAEQADIDKFIYVSAFNAQKYPEVRLLKAKERFASRLLSSKYLQPCVIRPNGFFSDLEEIYNMAVKGKVYLFGSGTVQLNPIHGEDLAKFCLEAMHRQEQELDVGGPEILSIDQMGKLSFQAIKKKENIGKLPDYIRRIALWVTKILPERWAGAAEFFLTMLEQDAIAPTYGRHKLGDYYTNISTLQK